MRLLLPLLACLLSCACAAPAQRNAGVEFVIVRHAEKASDGTRDPPLDAAGERRAALLGHVLGGEDLVAAYATQYRRTQQTAAPAAVAHGLQVTAYDAQVAAPEFAQQLRRAHASGMVLVVGHSDTVPGIVSALCRCTVAPLDEREYGDLYRVTVDAAGHAALSRGRFP